MEEEYIFFLGLVALVCGHTPTFRNEATHPLKAPTESTLGLQISDETVGRTKSNPSKADAYASGGKHFEYLVLNDSSVLLTSLQNDNLDLGAAQQTADNDTYSTKSNFLSHDNDKITLTTPGRFMSANSIPNAWKVRGIDKTRYPYLSKYIQSQMAEFAASREKISSTTKLYSRQPNRTENFATFTSPLAANKVQMDSESVQPSVPSEQPKMASTVAPNVQKQSYDYDDSFTKLLISNGILKPENKSIEPTQDAVKSILSQESKNSNPSAEDVSRIMDSSIGGQTRNDSLSRILKSPSRPIAESMLHEYKNETSIQSTETTPQASNSTPKVDQPVPDSATHITLSSIGKVNDKSADLPENFPVTGPKLGEAHDSNSETVLPSAFLTEELTTTTALDSNFTFISDTPPTIDTSQSTSTPADKSIIHIEKRLMKTYETTSQAKIISSAEFVHTDQSNENPLSAKAYTDIASNVESETENSPFASQPLQHSEYDLEDDPNRQFPILNRFLGDYQVLDMVKRSESTKPPQLPQPPQALTLKQHVLSVSEFKGLIEDTIRQLFYFVARMIREKNLLTPQMLLDDASANNRVTLKRFGFFDFLNAFEFPGEFEPSCHWIEMTDGETRDYAMPYDVLFDDNDNENARWLVYVGADNTTLMRYKSGRVYSIDYTHYTLAARLSLDYCGLKINAVIILPSVLVTNVTLPESDESTIDVNEELLIEEPTSSIKDIKLELGSGRYDLTQLFSMDTTAWAKIKSARMQSGIFKYQHEDVEFYIFVLGGAVCIFSILSPMLYGLYKVILSHRMHSSSSTSFRLPSIFRRHKFQYQQGHEKMPESRCESLNVIFSEEFDRKYSSWFDNTHHSSSILKASADGGSTSGGLYNDDSLDDYPEFSDLTRNVCENNSPRLSKENRLNMGCRPACVLLPHPATYLMQNEKDERYFDNPNYSR